MKALLAALALSALTSVSFGFAAAPKGEEAPPLAPSTSPYVGRAVLIKQGANVYAAVNACKTLSDTLPYSVQTRVEGVIEEAFNCGHELYFRVRDGQNREFLVWAADATIKI